MEREIFVKVSREELDKLDNKQEYSAEELIEIILKKCKNGRTEACLNPNTMNRLYVVTGSIDTEIGEFKFQYNIRKEIKLWKETLEKFTNWLKKKSRM